MRQLHGVSLAYCSLMIPRNLVFWGGVDHPEAGVTCGEVLTTWELRAVYRYKKQSSPENDPISPHWLLGDPSLGSPSLRAWEWKSELVPELFSFVSLEGNIQRKEVR